jgi:hypothetical protein
MSKIAISPGATGNAVFTIQAPSTETSRTLVLPDNAGTVLTSASDLAAANLSGRVPAANAPSGSVIQVVQVVKTDTFSSASTSFVDITGMSATITPSSNLSKILVMVNTAFTGHADSSVAGWRIVRGATAIGVGDAAGSRLQVTVGNQIGHQSNDQYHSSAVVLDSPNTTSATTYKIQGICNAGTGFYLNRSSGDSDTSTSQRAISTITLMEIAA